MTRYLHLILLLIIPFSLQAELYKSVNEEGNTTFSDKETPNSEIIPMRMPTAVPMPKPAPKKVETDSAITAYTSFIIVQPNTNETLRNSTGNVTVSLQLTPELDTEAGHRIVINIDGKPSVSGISTLTAQLSNISRGSHGVKAYVMDSTNKTLITSNKVIFHLKHQSELHTKPGDTGPTDPDGNPIKPGGTTPGPANPDGSLIKPGPNNPAYKPGPIVPVPIQTN